MMIEPWFIPPLCVGFAVLLYLSYRCGNLCGYREGLAVATHYERYERKRLLRNQRDGILRRMGALFQEIESEQIGEDKA